MSNNMLYNLKSLVIFRNLLSDPVLGALISFYGVPKNLKLKKIEAFSCFHSELLTRGGNLPKYLYEQVLTDCNIYTKALLMKNGGEQPLEPLVKRELKILEEASRFSVKDIPQSIRAYCPLLSQAEKIDFYTEYKQDLKRIGQTGFGIFAKFSSFSVEADGSLVGIKSHNVRRLENMYGYETARSRVLSNTEALVNGKPACNVLLYGDAGTGKSSTVKAVADHFKSRGLRLVELSKEQIPLIPQLVKELSDNPLKFILFIDDVIFSPDDPNFCLLKTLLDGNSAGIAPNIAVYATSNHRHLIRESEAERSGAVNEADYIQGAVALASRFGLTATFLKPERREYEDIVLSMISERKIPFDKEKLILRAEAYAIRNGGRTPRTAKQFVDLVASEIETVE